MATLLLRLAAPLQSWGADSKFEVRKTNREPTKSGVLGLLAAALGYRRDEDQAVQRLNALRFAVRVDREGELLVDFHTAGSPSPEEVRRARKAGKAPGAPYVSRRFYLSDAVFLVGLEDEEEAFLQELQAALTHPAFPLFLGRRSCPPTLPLCLGIRQKDLLQAMREEPSLTPPRRRADEPPRARLVYDAGPQQPGALPRRDVPLSFSPIHRQYGYRPAREEGVRLPAPRSQKETTDHDPFAALEKGGD